ncbi:MAG TPA: penicillin acylase family protein, partial [Myxococcaceae bacterium]|nr:penicillin acylase family protein [Myxococcaceae bacterium]
QPIATPHKLAPAQAEYPLPDKLDEAVLRLRDAGIALVASLCQLQFSPRGSRFPLHGGTGVDGTANVVKYREFKSTLDAPTPRGTVLDSQTGLSTEGYVVNYGTSFLMAMRYTDDGVEARALLTYGQSENPSSPHHDDQLALFSQKQWRPILFSEQQIVGDPALNEYTVSLQ